MSKNITTTFILICLTVSFKVIGQDSTSFRKLNISGYVSNNQTVMTSKDVEEWVKENTVHNRLIFNWNLNQKMLLDVQLRNRFIYGDMFENNPAYGKTFDSDKGLVDLSINWKTGASYLINTQIDRAFISYRESKFTFSAGRQRINWGQTFVWNPNDLFNTYSYFDFDYPERPGSDAIRFEYFSGYASGFEIAIKTDSTGDITGAALIKLNKWNYDIQLLGGIYEGDELVFGAGWSGNISKIGVYGEMSYFKGIKAYNKSKSYLFTSIAANYVTRKSLNIQTEFLFAHNPDGNSYGNFSDALNRPLNVKSLAFSKYSLFGAIGYPISPLLTGNISLMWMPDIKALYFGPNISYSLANNLESSFVLQHFRAKFKSENLSNVLTQTFTIALLRLKFSF